ncbi:MAG: hypothetical protein HY319_00985 [Armatimonadetes bacterium]|nr:hypothetical protein [Armatimonadota bacterium]
MLTVAAGNSLPAFKDTLPFDADAGPYLGTASSENHADPTRGQFRWARDGKIEAASWA